MFSESESQVRTYGTLFVVGLSGFRGLKMRLTVSMAAYAGEEQRGACKLLLAKERKCQPSKTYYFGPGLPPPGHERGDCRTLLSLRFYQCHHGPEDHRLQAGDLPQKKQRWSKKARGLGRKVCTVATQRLLIARSMANAWCLLHAVRASSRVILSNLILPPSLLQVGCKVHMTLRVFARPDLRHLCKVSVFVQEHTNHGADAVLPQHRGQMTLSEVCKSAVAQAACFGPAPGEVQRRNLKRVHGNMVPELQSRSAGDPQLHEASPNET